MLFIILYCCDITSPNLVKSCKPELEYYALQVMFYSKTYILPICNVLGIFWKYTVFFAHSRALSLCQLMATVTLPFHGKVMVFVDRPRTDPHSLAVFLLQLWW